MQLVQCRIMHTASINFVIQFKAFSSLRGYRSNVLRFKKIVSQNKSLRRNIGSFRDYTRSKAKNLYVFIRVCTALH